MSKTSTDAHVSRTGTQVCPDARPAGARAAAEFGCEPSTLRVISQAPAARWPVAPAPHAQQACHPAA